MRNYKFFMLITIFCLVSCARGEPSTIHSPQTNAKVANTNKAVESKIVHSASPKYVATETEKLQLSIITNKLVIAHGHTERKRIALTFDDGPDNEMTLRVMEILRREGVTATFFVCGYMVKKYPHILRQMDEAGFTIGNHSWNHPQLTLLSNKQIASQITRTNDSIYEVIGKRPHLFRAPYGALNMRVNKQIKSHGLYNIFWSIDTKDWSGKTGKEIRELVQHHATPGAIILQHSVGATIAGTVEALPGIIKFLKENEYELVTVDELLNVKAYEVSTH